MGVHVAKVTVEISEFSYQILAQQGEKYDPDLTMSQLLELEVADLTYRAIMASG